MKFVGFVQTMQPDIVLKIDLKAYVITVLRFRINLKHIQ
jgi:hypothetical protein